MTEARTLRAARGLFTAIALAVDVPVAIRLWDGTRIPLCAAPAPAPRLEIRVASPGVLGALLRRPRLENVVAHYVSGGLELKGGDLLELIALLRRRNAGAHGRVDLRDLPKWRLLRHALPLLGARDRANPPAPEPGASKGEASKRSLESDRASVQFHYDLGNDFYRLFLDSEMQYSCAYFEAENGSLEEAQQAKLEMTCRKLRLQPGERFLDIGCGWGGLVCHAARTRGVEALGITLSEEQHALAKEKVAALGLEKQVTIELRDYRELRADGSEPLGHFDKIASVGMVEHVGIARYPEYFARLASLLRDRGLLLNHGITRGAKKTPRQFRRRRPEKQWMLRHVFPGHELDHIGHTLSVMEAHGFEIRDVEGWREHYALTTRHWFERLSARSEEAEAIVGAERVRTWLAYLAGVSSAFHDGSLRIYQVVASRHGKKGASELPLTRADLYDG